MMADNIRLLLEFFAFLGSVVFVYVQLSNKISELDIRLRVQEKQEEKVLQKLDALIEKINDLEIKLQNKVNR
jgi:chaperonin cofactor prefoldin